MMKKIFSAVLVAVMMMTTGCNTGFLGGLSGNDGTGSGGSLGDVFAIDVQFEIEQPQAVRASFESGPAGRVMALLEEWGLADKRWQLGAQSAFARAIPVECDDGSTSRYAFTLMPQWAKVRWTNKTLQPAKLYLLAHAGLMEA